MHVRRRRCFVAGRVGGFLGCAALLLAGCSGGTGTSADGAAGAGGQGGTASGGGSSGNGGTSGGGGGNGGGGGGSGGTSSGSGGNATTGGSVSGGAGGGAGNTGGSVRGGAGGGAGGSGGAGNTGGAARGGAGGGGGASLGGSGGAGGTTTRTGGSGGGAGDAGTTTGGGLTLDVGGGTLEDRDLRGQRGARRVCEERLLLHPREPHRRGQEVRTRDGHHHDRGRSDQAHHPAADRSGRHRDRRGDLPRSRRTDHPGREVRRRTHPDRGDGARRGHDQRAPRVDARRRRIALRFGPAPARPAQHQGHRPGSAPVQHRGLHPLSGVEPRLRHPVGQHLVHAVRGSVECRALAGRVRAVCHRRRSRRRQRELGLGELVGHGHPHGDRRPHLPHLLVGHRPAFGEQPGGHRSLPPGLAAERGHRPREADGRPGRAGQAAMV